MTVTSHLQGRRLPRPSEIRRVLKLRRPRIGRLTRLADAQTVSDLSALAKRRVPRAVFDYVEGGAEAEISVRRSVEAFARIEFSPRVLAGSECASLSTSILGLPAQLPVILAPTGFTRMMHHDGEVAAATAARNAGVPYVLSTLGTTPPEGLPVGDWDRWFQVYLWKDRSVTQAMIDRAQRSGFRALVLTVDTPVAGARDRDRRNGFSVPPSLGAKTLWDMARRPRWWFNVLTTQPLEFASLTSTGGDPSQLVNRVFNASADMADLSWLRQTWGGPLVVKGVLSGREAKRVVDAGADAVVVSNHGGRQLDRASTPLEVLPEVVQSVGPHAEVYLDGGVRSGADVAAAVGLGARACLVGRAYLYGLMAGGQPGVERVLDIMRNDLARTMTLAGCGELGDLQQNHAVTLRSSR